MSTLFLWLNLPRVPRGSLVARYPFNVRSFDTSPPVLCFLSCRFDPRFFSSFNRLEIYGVHQFCNSLFLKFDLFTRRLTAAPNLPFSIFCGHTVWAFPPLSCVFISSPTEMTPCDFFPFFFFQAFTGASRPSSCALSSPRFDPPLSRFFLSHEWPFNFALREKTSIFVPLSNREIVQSHRRPQAATRGSTHVTFFISPTCLPSLFLF